MMENIFSTNRLLVRNLQISDSEKFHELQGNPNVMKYASVSGNAMNKEESQKDLISVISKYEIPSNDLWVWAIEKKGSCEFVGTCALVHSGDKIYEIGYRILESGWGNGFGGEVSDALIDFAIGNWNAKEVFAIVDKRNIGSVRILERSKLHFVREFWNAETETRDLEFRLKTSE